jgi:hypothetical protein
MRIGDLATTYDFAFGSAFESGGLFAALGQLALGHFGVFGHGGRRFWIVSGAMCCVYLFSIDEVGTKTKEKIQTRNNNECRLCVAE